MKGPYIPSQSYVQGTFAKETRYYVDPVSYLTKSDTPSKKETSSSDNRYKVTAKTLRVRSGPGLTYATTKLLKKDTVVTVYTTKNGFAGIAQGKAEWCSLDYLEKI